MASNGRDRRPRQPADDRGHGHPEGDYGERHDGDGARAGIPAPAPRRPFAREFSLVVLDRHRRSASRSRQAGFRSPGRSATASTRCCSAPICTASRSAPRSSCCQPCCAGGARRPVRSPMPADALTRLNRQEARHDEKPPRRAHCARRRDRRLLRLRPRALLHPGLLQVAAGGDHGIRRRRAAAGGRDLLRGLRRGHRALAAGRGHPDAGGGRDLRSALGHRDRLLRLGHRCDARFPRQPLPVPGRDPEEVRRQARGDQPRRREGRRLLPLHAAAGAGVSVLRHQSRDGPHPDQDPHVLLGEPGRHAARNAGIRECRHPARKDRFAQGNPVAGPAALVRPARLCSR